MNYMVSVKSGICLTASISTLTVLAETTPVVDPGLGTLISNLGIMGVLVWHLWYHTTVAQPKQTEKFTLEQQLQRDAFVREQQLLRDLFAKEQTSLRDTFAKEQQAQRDYYNTQTNELRNMLIQNLQAMRSAVHDVRDVASVAVNKANVAMEEAKQSRAS